MAFVLIAGDLYDGDWPDYNTGPLLRRPDGPAPRRGDPGLPDPGQPRRGQQDDPRPAAARTTSGCFDRPARRRSRWTTSGWRSTARASPPRAVTDEPGESIPDGVPGLFNIGLLHTCAEGREGHEPLRPVHGRRPAAPGYGYWALGHVHTPRGLARDDPLIAFPGNVQGRHIREPGPKGCLLVHVDDARQRRPAEFRPLDVVRWEVCRVDASGASDGDDLLDRFRDARSAPVARPATTGCWPSGSSSTGPCPAHAAVSADRHALDHRGPPDRDERRRRPGLGREGRLRTRPPDAARTRRRRPPRRTGASTRRTPGRRPAP